MQPIHKMYLCYIYERSYDDLFMIYIIIFLSFSVKANSFYAFLQNKKDVRDFKRQETEK